MHTHSHPHDDHDHSHGHHHHGHGSAPRSIAWALGVTASFMVVEIVGGYLANSLALISDGVHMATDAGALTLSLFTLWLAQRPAGTGFTYGYQRVEILGALANGLLVWLLAGFLIFESLERFSAPEDVNGEWVLGIASVGLVANLVSMALLHRSQKENMNVRAAYLHVLTDCLGSAGAMVAGAVIWLTGWRLIDPIVTCALSALMLWSSWRLVKEAVGVLMERMPLHLSKSEIERKLMSVPGVTGLHDLHVWTLSSGKIALSVHLMGGGAGILAAANELLAHEFGITHTTIQIEAGADSLEHCEDCN